MISWLEETLDLSFIQVIDEESIGQIIITM